MTRTFPVVAMRTLALYAIAAGFFVARDSAVLGAARQTGSTSISASTDAPFFGLTPQFAVSPDGTKVVFVATPRGAGPMLFLRSLASNDARPIRGTEQASYPFWAPDGRYLGFFASGKLQRISLTEDIPTVICDAPNGRGATWNTDGVIVFGSGITDPLRKVSAAGGATTSVTTVDTSRENSHRFPQFLPDGQHFLFWAGAGRAPSELRIGSLASPDTASVVSADTNGSYAAGYVFFGSGNALMAQAFDLQTMTKKGDPIRVVEPLSGDAGSNVASFSVSTSGTLLYVRGSARPLVLTWFDRTGRPTGSFVPRGQYTNVALSPDETRVAVSFTAGSPANRDVWIAVATDAMTRVTSDPAVDATPVWSPDGRQLVFSSQRAGPYQMFRRTLLGDGSDELLLKSDVPTIATDWSRDGRYILYTRGTAATGMSVWMLPLSGDRTPVSLIDRIAGAGAKDNAVFSPDGRWVTYQSNESGRDEIYASPTDQLMELSEASRPAAPGEGRRVFSLLTTPPHRVSAAGGTQPLWRADGKELFYLGPDGAVMAAAVGDGSGAFDGGAPRKLFAAPLSLVIRRSYAVTSDGQRFLIPILDESNPPVITVVPNWPATLAK